MRDNPETPLLTHPPSFKSPNHHSNPAPPFLSSPSLLSHRHSPLHRSLLFPPSFLSPHRHFERSEKSAFPFPPTALLLLRPLLFSASFLSSGHFSSHRHFSPPYRHFERSEKSAFSLLYLNNPFPSGFRVHRFPSPQETRTPQ